MLHRRLLRLTGAVTAPVAAATLASLLTTAMHLTQALVLANVLRHLAAGDLPAAWTTLTWAVAVLIGAAVATWARELVVVRCGIAVRTRLRDRLVEQLGRLGPAHAAGARAGQVQAVLVTGVEGLDAYFSRYLPQLAVTVLVPPAIVAWLCTVSRPAGTLLAVAVAVALVVPRLFDAALLRRGTHRWRAFTRLGADHLEATQAIPTLRVFGAGERVGANLAHASDRLYRTTMAQLRSSVVESGVSALAMHGGIAAALVVVSWSLVSGTAAPAEAFVLLLCARECFRPLRDLSTAWHAGYLGLTAYEGIEEILSARPVVLDGPVATPLTRPPELRFDDVTFSYPSASDDPRGRPRPALRGVTLHCPPGAMLGIVGPSGGGKSTLARLLQRHHDPATGQILLEDHPLTDLTLSALRRSIAVVGQHPYLFHATVADNIRLARPEAPDEDVVAAAIHARAHDFITALPDGYRTIVGERGSTLSGGQRQRLALARAVLTDAPVLLLDEATAHLDLVTEESVMASLDSHFADRTRIVIAHRLDTIRRADVIAYVADGCVVETGTPADLLARADGAYRALVDRHAARTVDR